MDLLPESYSQIINLLIYLAIALHFIFAGNNDNRFKFLIVLSGFFALSLFFGDNFLILQPFVIGWLILTGTKMLFPKEIMIGLLALLVILSATSPIFFTLMFLFYIVVLLGFIFTAFSKAGKAISGVK